MAGGKGKNEGKKDGVPFKKGDPRINREGRPLKLPGLDQLLEETLGKETNNVSAMQLIIEALIKKALKGDVRAIELIMNRAYGMLKRTMDMDVSIDNLNKHDLSKICEFLLKHE